MRIFIKCLWTFLRTKFYMLFFDHQRDRSKGKRKEGGWNKNLAVCGVCGWGTGLVDVLVEVLEICEVPCLGLAYNRNFKTLVTFLLGSNYTLFLMMWVSKHFWLTLLCHLSSVPFSNVPACHPPSVCVTTENVSHFSGWPPMPCRNP